MAGFPMRMRQIHLDFHTSEAIAGIGSKFDPDEFGDTLQEARVNSITCFARGHHGWIYYDSAAHPERIHPQLARRNLLVEQIQACHARGIRAPVYTTVQWDHLDGAAESRMALPQRRWDAIKAMVCTKPASIAASP